MQTKRSRDRNYGIDLLRVVSMFMIVILHVLLRSGTLNSLSKEDSSYWIVWSLETFAYCAVNCFALISGFVMWKSSSPLKKLLRLWLQIIFYTLLMTTVFQIIMPNNIHKDNFIEALFPITNRKYWYLTCYFGLYLFAPLLNASIKNLDYKTFKTVLVSVFVGLLVLPMFTDADPYKLSAGYSMIWLLILYLFGGYISKYKLYKKIKKRASILGYLITVVLTILAKFFFDIVIKKPDISNRFISYTSPLIFLSGVFLLLFFANLNLNRLATKLTKFFSPVALDIYIIHANPLIWKYAMPCIVSYVALQNHILIVLSVLGLALAIFVTCSLVAYVRLFIFQLIQKQTSSIRKTPKPTN